MLLEIQRATLKDLKEIKKISEPYCNTFISKFERFFYWFTILCGYVFIGIKENNIISMIVIRNNKLGHLVVNSDYRKEGIGSSMIEFALNRVAENYNYAVGYCHSDKLGYYLSQGWKINQRIIYISKELK